MVKSSREETGVGPLREEVPFTDWGRYLERLEILKNALERYRNADVDKLYEEELGKAIKDRAPVPVSKEKWEAIRRIYRELVKALGKLYSNVSKLYEKIEELNEVVKRQKGMGEIEIDVGIAKDIVETYEAMLKMIESFGKRIERLAKKDQRLKKYIAPSGEERHIAWEYFRRLSEYSDVNYGTRAVAVLWALAAGNKPYSNMTLYLLREGRALELLLHLPSETSWKYEKMAELNTGKNVKVSPIVEAVIRLLLGAIIEKRYPRNAVLKRISEMVLNNLEGKIPSLGWEKLILEQNETEKSTISKQSNIEMYIIKDSNGEMWKLIINRKHKVYLLEFPERIKHVIRDIIGDVKKELAKIDEPKKLWLLKGWLASDLGINPETKKFRTSVNISSRHLWQIAELLVLVNPREKINIRGLALTQYGYSFQLNKTVQADHLNVVLKESVEKLWNRNNPLIQIALNEIEKIVRETAERLRQGSIREVKVHWKEPNKSSNEISESLERALENLKFFISEFGELAMLYTKKDQRLTREQSRIILKILRKILVWLELLALHDEEGFGYAMRGVVMGDGYVDVRGFIIMGVGLPRKNKGLVADGLTPPQRRALEIALNDASIYALLVAATLAKYGYIVRVYNRSDSSRVYQIYMRGDFKKIQTFEFDKKYGNYKAMKLERIRKDSFNRTTREISQKLINDMVGVVVEGLKLGVKSPTAYLIAKAGGSVVRLRLHMRERLELVFGPSSRERAEEAARVLRALGVEAEPRQHGGRWRVYVTTNAIASAHPELRKAVARAVEAAAERGAVKGETAERWLRKLRTHKPLD